MKSRLRALALLLVLGSCLAPAPSDDESLRVAEFSIQRDRPIHIDEWRAFVASDERMRFTAGDDVAVNPKTNERIVIPAREGDVEVLIDRQARRWEKVFRITPRGSVSFVANVDSGGIPKAPIRELARHAANRLNAIIRTEDGEVVTW